MVDDVKHSVRTLALDATKRAAFAADRVRPPHDGAVILIYHRVGGAAPVELDLPRAQFSEQMRHLAAGSRAVTLDDALVSLATGGPRPDGLHFPVVVTFDDGTADFVDDALPVLEETKVPALLYLATGFVATSDALPYGGRPLSWSALRDALSTGLVTIGSHTHSHRVLDGLTVAEIEDEFERSRRLIEDELGVTPVHFAYPKGVAHSPIADGAVRAEFQSAATGEIRTNRFGATDPYRLGRTPIQRSDHQRWFAAKIDGGMTLEGTLRLWLNRVRYRNATH